MNTIEKDKIKRILYIKKGYPNTWINIRIESIPIRNQLTGEWKNRGISHIKDFAILTDEISINTFGINTYQHKTIKNLERKHNLRDHMSILELVITTLAEATTTEFHKINNSNGIIELINDAKIGGEIAAHTRTNIENKTGKSIITSSSPLI